MRCKTIAGSWIGIGSRDEILVQISRINLPSDTIYNRTRCQITKTTNGLPHVASMARDLTHANWLLALNDRRQLLSNNMESLPMRFSTAPTIAALLIITLSGIPGCATIVHLGGSEELNVTSEPSGAKVVVDGMERGITPVAVDVERKKPHKILVSKDGYQESQLSVDSSLSWWIAGNIVFGGLVGLLVDVLSGGGYTIDPDKLAVTLQSSSIGPVESPGSVSTLHPSPLVP